MVGVGDGVSVGVAVQVGVGGTVVDVGAGIVGVCVEVGLGVYEGPTVGVIMTTTSALSFPQAYAPAAKSAINAITTNHLKACIQSFTVCTITLLVGNAMMLKI